jgi:hypothetical protein
MEEIGQEGTKVYADGAKVYAEGTKVYAEGTKDRRRGCKESFHDPQLQGCTKIAVIISTADLKNV